MSPCRWPGVMGCRSFTVIAGCVGEHPNSQSLSSTHRGRAGQIVGRCAPRCSGSLEHSTAGAAASMAAGLRWCRRSSIGLWPLTTPGELWQWWGLRGRKLSSAALRHRHPNGRGRAGRRVPGTPVPARYRRLAGLRCRPSGRIP